MHRHITESGWPSDDGATRAVSRSVHGHSSVCWLHCPAHRLTSKCSIPVQSGCRRPVGRLHHAWALTLPIMGSTCTSKVCQSWRRSVSDSRCFPESKRMLKRLASHSSHAFLKNQSSCGVQRQFQCGSVWQHSGQRGGRSTVLPFMRATLRRHSLQSAPSVPRCVKCPAQPLPWLRQPPYALNRSSDGANYDDGTRPSGARVVIHRHGHST